MIPFMAVCTSVLLILTLPVSSAAATRTWTGGGGLGNTFWSNPANWESGVVPVDGDDLVFPAGTAGVSTNDLPNLLVRSLSFSSSHVATGLMGAGIRLQNGITVSSPGGGAIVEPLLDLPMAILGDQTWTLGPNTSLQSLTNGGIALVNARLTLHLAERPVVLAGVISGTGGLTMFGNELHLRGNNTFEGTAEVRGRLYLEHVSALGVGDGTAANGTIVNNGRVYLPDSVLPPEAFTLGMSGVDDGRLIGGHGDGATTTLTGPITLGPLPLDPNPYTGILSSDSPTGILRVEGVVSGPGRLTLAGNVVLLNTNTYTGGTTYFSSYDIAIEADEALGPGSSIHSAQGTKFTLRRRTQTIRTLGGRGTVIFESGPNPGERATVVMGVPFAQPFPLTFTGTLVGAGTIRFAAQASHRWDTESPGMTGDVRVEQGAVTLLGALAADITVTGGELAVGVANNGPLTVSGGRLVLNTPLTSSTSLSVTGGEVDVRQWTQALVLGRIAVSGPVSLGGALSAALPAETFPVGAVFTIIDKTSPGAVTGTFDGLPEGATFASGGNQLRISYVGGDGNDVTMTLVSIGRRYLLSEGATSTFFTTDIAVANPHADTRTARLDFFPTGGNVVSVDLTLAPFSRRTVRVNDIPALAAAEFSTEVRSLTGVPLIVERTMAWDGATGYGAHTEHAVEALGTTWYFAEGAEGFFKTFLLLANPQDTQNVATVEYLRDGELPIVRTYPLQPRARFTVDIGADAALVDRSFGMVVTFQKEGMAERAMYFGTTPFLTGGHESAGVTQPSEMWFVPEGATGTFFETFILIANPSVSKIQVRLDFLPLGGTPVASLLTLEPKSRTTVNIETVDPSLTNAAVATQVSAPVPIVVERATYWPDPAPSWYEAHNSFGVTQPGTQWGLAEGRTGQARSYQTYILLANPGDQAATVEIKFLREGDKLAVTKSFDVPARSRFNVSVGPGSDVPELQDESFGALITSTQPIAVERAMYSTPNGQPIWAAGTSATAVRLQ
jgi:hypothetical protein